MHLAVGSKDLKISLSLSLFVKQNKKKKIKINCKKKFRNKYILFFSKILLLKHISYLLNRSKFRSTLPPPPHPNGSGNPSPRPLPKFLIPQTLWEGGGRAVGSVRRDWRRRQEGWKMRLSCLMTRERRKQRKVFSVAQSTHFKSTLYP